MIKTVISFIKTLNPALYYMFGLAVLGFMASQILELKEDQKSKK